MSAPAGDDRTRARDAELGAIGVGWARVVRHRGEFEPVASLHPDVRGAALLFIALAREPRRDPISRAWLGVTADRAAIERAASEFSLAVDEQALRDLQVITVAAMTELVLP